MTEYITLEALCKHKFILYFMFEVVNMFKKRK